MTLEDLFDDLTYGEFSQLNLGGAETQGITVDNRRQVVSHINRALTALHRRFRLKEARYRVPLEPGVTEYSLRPENPPLLRVEYIPWPEGFKDSVVPPRGLKPMLPLNDDSNDLSAYTPNTHTLEVPERIQELGVTELTVVYRANHKPIDKETGPFAPEAVEVDLPEAFREALLFYVSGCVMNPLGFGPEGSHEGNNYMQKFEMECQTLETRGWDLSTMPNRTGFEARGFV